MVEHRVTQRPKSKPAAVQSGGEFERQDSRAGATGVVHSKQRRKVGKIQPDVVHATVLFADMRGYTGLAERLGPAMVLTLLDEFFGVLMSATTAFGGQVFHLAGDGMMAGFGIGDPDPVGARAAFAAGHAMLQQFGPLAARWKRDLDVVTGVGVGLHFGEVALGFLGPPGKRAITLVGDTANVAARLCSRARTGEVLFSCSVATALRADGAVSAPLLGSLPFLQLPQFELRGRSGLLDIWCVPAAGRLDV